MATLPNPAFDTGLPANVEAEKTILGAILLDNAAHSEAAEKIESDDFSLDSHRRIFLRMTELMNDAAGGGHCYAGRRAGPLQGAGRHRRRGLPGITDRGFAAPSGDRRVHPHRQGQEPAAQADADLLDGHCARRRPERDGAGGSGRGGSATDAGERKGPYRRLSIARPDRRSTPSGPSTTCTSRAARSPDWPPISPNSTA